MENTLQIELTLEQGAATYSIDMLHHVMNVYTVLLSEDNEPQFVGSTMDGKHIRYIFCIDVSHEIYESFSSEYGVFLENYFGHIPASEFAVAHLKVRDGKAVEEQLQNFLSKFSLDLQNSM